MKVFRDGDGELPTICGTGLEDYVGSAWGMGAHAAPYGGAPLEIVGPAGRASQPDFVGFYRWHVLDPIMFDVRPAGHDPADRRRSSSPLGGRPRSRRTRRRTRSPARAGSTREGRVPRVGHRRARRRLLRDVVRVLHAAAAGAAARARRRGRRHRAPSVGDRPSHGSGHRSRRHPLALRFSSRLSSPQRRNTQNQPGFSGRVGPCARR